MSYPTGVWVTGPSRSGTSMTAGLFERHGVFFGPSISANRYNPKGYFESTYLKRLIRENRIPEGWPRPWYVYLHEEGLCSCGQSWGVKIGARRADWVLPMEPAVIVVTKRPLEQIRRSRERVHWARASAEKAVRATEAAVRGIRERADTPIIEVRTDRLVAGEYDEIEPAFEYLTPNFSRSVARDWIDPELWNR